MHVDSSYYYNAATKNHMCTTYSISPWTSIKCSAIVSLKKGDTVGVYLDTDNKASAKSLGENDDKYTNFIGMLLG